MTLLWILTALLALLAAIALYDVLQKKHTILRNFPIIGHFRYLLEAVGPELRQYIVTDNDEERPFTRDQRTWVYTAAKEVNTCRGFGTDNDLELSPNYVVVLHSSFPKTLVKGDDPEFRLPCAKVLGGARNRIDADCIEVLDAQYGARCVRDLFGYEPGWGAVSPERVELPPTS